MDATPKHKLLLELGRGGMGTVYLAVSRGPAGFGKRMVVKRLRADLASDEHFLKMFLDEARLAARLDHPNIVQTREVGFDGANYFLEMEYLEGQSFDALLQRASKAGGLPLETALYVISKALAGLHYAHEMRDDGGEPLRIVHRDVSPHNLLVTYDGAVKVLDFGIAKAANSSTNTKTGVVKGKATYMAPEQAARGKVDRRADVFAMGVILWEVLTGKRLWGRASELEIFLALKKGPPPAPRSVEASVPAALDAICVKALAYDAEGRFATAQEMQRAIEGEIAAFGPRGRAGSESLAKIVRELFADMRVAVAEEIDALLKEPESTGKKGGRRGSEVPVLAAATPGEARIGPMKSKNVRADEDSTKATKPSARTSATPKDEDDRPAPRAPRTGSHRTFRLVSIGLLVAAVGGGTLAFLGRLEAGPPRAGSLEKATRGGEGGRPATAAECVTNKECIDRHGGAPFLCRKADGRCVDLKLHGCEPYGEPADVANDDTLWFGVMTTTEGERGREFAEPQVRAIERGLADVRKAAGGMPSPVTPGRVSPLAFVLCDDSADAMDKANFLAAEVGVPAVIGFGDGKVGIDLASRALIPRHVTTILTNPDATIRSVPPSQPGGVRLLWSSTVAFDALALASAAVAENVLQPEILRDEETTADVPLRVALLRRTNSADVSFSDALYAALRFNGKTALENGPDFIDVPYGDHADAAAAEAAKSVQKVLELRPHIVIVSGESDVFANLLEPIEQGWPRDAKARPRYVYASSLASAEGLAFLGADKSRQHRTRGLVARGQSPSEWSDAFYLAMYAMFASGEERPTGDGIGRGILRLLPPGVPVDVGPGPLLDALSVLRRGANIDLNGVMTPLDLDPATGESPPNLVVTCARVGGRGRAVDEMESGIVVEAPHARLTGTLSPKCP